ncbi:MAG: DegQ family serine endoprotease [Gammaproteobacteria bacterium]|nr:DegQ family serine endoprotease [Gammaproteobacteria bacterium]
MNRDYKPLLGAVTALALLLGVAQQSMAQAAALPDFKNLVKDNAATVVNVSTEQSGEMVAGLPPGMPDLPEGSPLNDFFRRFFENRPEQAQRVRSLGSGTVISSDGYILTNAHVVKDADRITVRFNDHREKPATLVGMDERSDVALLKVDAKDLPTAHLGDSDSLEVGEWVLAIGSPFGLEHTATAGIVSALGRNLPSDTYVPFIQTDVAVNPGNSGGPLFDTQGDVVGINSQIYSKTGGYMGLSFAIPINVAMKVVEQLKTTGHVERGWLGVMIQGVNQDLAESFGLDRPRGALVAQVTPESPAAKAGLEAGDVILGFAGEAIEQSSQLPPLVGDTRPGTEVGMRVLRGGKEREIKVTIEALTEESSALAAPHGGAAVLKMAVRNLTREQRDELKEGGRGVLVTGVEPGPAAEAGIRPGDVILSLDGKDVTGVDKLAGLVKELPRGKGLPLLIRRGDGNVFLALRLPDSD